MAPAHTSTTNQDGHGVHLSSPLSNTLDSDGGAVLGVVEMEPQMKRTKEDGYSQKMDFRLSTLEVPLLPRMLAGTTTSASHYKAVLLPSPAASILSLLSLHNKSFKDSPRRVAPAPTGLPAGAPDTCSSLPVPVEHSRKEAARMQPPGQPDCRDVPQAPVAPLPSLFHGDEEKVHHGLLLLTHPVTVTQGKKEEEVVDSHHRTPALAQPYWGAGSDSPDRGPGVSSEAGPEEEEAAVTVRELTRWQLSRQAGLQSWAARLQRRLQALQGRHAVLHCSQQLEGLEKALRQTTRGTSSSSSVSSNTQDGSKPPTRRCTTGCGARLSPLESSAAELEEFGCSSQAVLRVLQGALDSDATACSSSCSSDEELDLESRPRGSKPTRSRRRSNGHSGVTVVPGSSERRWQEDRAEVCSRWSWLQLRVAELQGRIQQLEELHKHVCSTKGGVVLAKSQPLTDRQIQQTLLRETAGLSSYTTTAAGAGELPADTDSEPSSPTRLFHNIQRQSAQLSQIVTSLSAFSSPISSKPPQAWKGLSKRAFSRSSLGEGYEPVTLAGGSKRRKVLGRSRQQLLRADASRVCARTRPLVTYHKPRLFTLHLHATTRGSPQRVESSPSSSTCPSCSSCDPVTLCSDPSCTSNTPSGPCRPHTSSSGPCRPHTSSSGPCRPHTSPSGPCRPHTSSNTSSSGPCRPHPVLSLSSDTPLSHHLQTALAREEWLQRPLVVKAERSSPGRFNAAGYQSHRHHMRHARGVVRDPSGAAQTPNSRANQRRRKGHAHTVTDGTSLPGRSSGTGLRCSMLGHTPHHSAHLDEEDFLSQLSDPEDSSEDTWSPQTSHTRKQSTPGPVRRRQGDDSVYDIHNLAFPMALVSMAKVEKMEYKNILTRGWRVVECPSPGGKPEEEAVTDAAFHQRHTASEQREKQGWSALSMSPSYKQPSRSGSRWSASVEEGACSSSSWSEDGTMGTEQERTGAEEWLPPLSPWELRVFPLAEDQEKALFSEEEAAAPRCCPAPRPRTTPPSSPSSSSTTVLASKSQLSSLALSSSTTTPPSGGQRRNCAPNGRIA